jgi:hypothetical protein
MTPVLFQGSMKINVSKMAAAKSQLLEAINLFLEERDPISIHTLTCAALQILHDHFDDVGQVWDHKLIFHSLSSNSKCNTTGPGGLGCCHVKEILSTHECGRP